MAATADDTIGKIFYIFFPTWLFVTSGFVTSGSEHSIANMYHIPAEILAKSNDAWYQAALGLGVSPEKIVHLNWGAFVANKLLPLMLGNIVGCVIFVVCSY